MIKVDKNSISDSTTMDWSASPSERCASGKLSLSDFDPKKLNKEFH